MLPSRRQRSRWRSWLWRGCVRTSSSAGLGPSDVWASWACNAEPSEGKSECQFSAAVRCDPFLAPCWIVGGHFNDQRTDVGGHAGSAAGPRFPFPKETETLAMPTNQRVGFDDRESISPIEETGESNERKANGGGGPPRFRCRSTYSPSCLRRNRFSAATEAGERRRRRKNVSRSANTARTLRTNVKRAERLDGGAAIR